MLDIDEFKAVNDRDGHEAGDRLLVTVAEALRGRVRETDTLARLGGDEFAVILHQADWSSLRRVADDLIEVVNAACPDGAAAAAHISIGGAPFTADSTASGLLAQADRAMYQAKRRGGHQAVLEQ